MYHFAKIIVFFIKIVIKIYQFQGFIESNQNLNRAVKQKCLKTG